MVLGEMGINLNMHFENAMVWIHSHNQIIYAASPSIPTQFPQPMISIMAANDHRHKICRKLHVTLNLQDIDDD
jgi:predicted TIM-barrel fold metal-dependent hydrolase